MHQKASSPVGRSKIMMIAVASSMILAGCGGGSAKTAAPSGTDNPAGNSDSVQAAAAKLLPDKTRKSGVLRIATSLQWPPFGYKGSDGKPTGLDIELTQGIAKRLGLTPQITDVQFPTLVPGVATGRFDIAVNELADTAERRKEAQFVDYYDTGLALLVKKGTTGIAPNDLCGHSLALTQGSSQVAIAQDISAKCVADGKKKIKFVTVPESAATILAVSSGRAEGFLTDNAVGVYMSKSTHTNLEVIPGKVPSPSQRAGIVIKKGNDELTRAVQSALQSMIDDGTYAKLYKKYNVRADNMLTKATINDGRGL
ncbi:ABC transporter substrate-binding protein [Segeticoccus rhizosphaerae]|uniref:ABC transporter substrate-binding protein n=1 Tax=Segeticoccus rhizosphaerae TaxID=1104777 RepID=UPI0012648F19|nr:ABC transporter substrate-binding protein [Segeticoccus rhizosphaerae]